MRILVIGDVILDRYVYVSSTRTAPEAPIPVWDELREEYRLGGAANVANNLRSIGGSEVEVYLSGIFKKNEVNKALVGVGIDTILCAHGQTMVKNRFVQGEKIVFRSDVLKRFDEQSVFDFEHQLISFCTIFNAPRWDAVIVSDYDKGTITPNVMTLLKGLGVSPIVVDSKRQDLRMFEGSQVLKVNSYEHGVQSTMSHVFYDNRCVESMFDYCVVTRGSEGADLLQCEKVKSDNRRHVVHRENFPVEPVKKVVDVTGCGDTHTAALTFALIKNGGDIRAAIKFANAYARSVVQKFGTSVAQANP